MEKVAVIKCENYANENVSQALLKGIDLIGGISQFIKPNSTVVLKANLIIKFAPERAATTHPSIVGNLAKICLDAGAKVIVADSAGGPFNEKYMGAIYNVSGMTQASKDFGFELNSNYNAYQVNFEKAKVAKNFEILEVLQNADTIINVCKLKSHSFTGITNAVKNMFGAVPGLKKVEMHGQFQTLDNFSNMLYDIWDYFGNKIAFSVCDAVVGMEGEGPTNGKPVKIGAIMVSKNPVAIDVLGARIMNANPETLPTIETGIKRGYINDVNNFETVGESIENFVLPNFDKRTPNVYTPFSTNVPRFLQPILHKLTTQRPCIKKRKCVGCATCAKHCPVGAITMVTKKNGKKYAKFNYSKCIRCFCCQELCPFGVVNVKKGIVYKILNRKKGKNKWKN